MEQTFKKNDIMINIQRVKKTYFSAFLFSRQNMAKT